MITLDYTDAHFRIDGVSMPGVPMLLDDDENFVREPQLWLIDRARAGRSRNTLRTYAESLVDWLNHCEANGWDFREKAVERLQLYKIHMLRATSVLGKAYAASTINIRLRAVEAFYIWAGEEGHLPQYAVRSEKVRVSAAKEWDALAHIHSDRIVDRSELSVKNPPTLPRTFTKTEVMALMQAMSRPRDRLILRWGLYTGGRIGEIIGLRLDELPPMRLGEALPPFVRVEIDSRRVKGRRKDRALYAPRGLIDETFRYINRQRAALLRGIPNANRPPEVFLSERRGREGTKAYPLTIKAFQGVMATARDKANLQQGWFHMCRHTYAVAMLHAYTQAYTQRESGSTPHINAVKTVQLLLGHTNLSTTSLYLESMQLDDDALQEALATLGEFFDGDEQQPEVDFAAS